MKALADIWIWYSALFTDRRCDETIKLHIVSIVKTLCSLIVFVHKTYVSRVSSDSISKYKNESFGVRINIHDISSIYGL